MNGDRETVLVVVGAGASYACLPDDAAGLVRSEGLVPMDWSDVRPPLTQSLIGPGRLQDETLARYPAARPLVAELRAALTGPASTETVLSFEALLGEYEQSATANPQRLRHLAALRFYLRDLLWACTDYVTAPSNGSGLTAFDRLVNELQHWAARHDRHVCFVNFNYDLILETACRDVFGFRPGALDTYAADPHVSVTKPHGSVNWAWRLEETDGPLGTPRPVDQTVIARAAAGLAVVPGSLHVDSYVPHRQPPTAKRQPTLPALALPVTDKQEFVWPGQQHRFVAEGLRSNVRAVVTLGWRGLEPHFLGLLPSLVRAAHVLVVTGGEQGIQDAEGVRAALTAHGDVQDLIMETQGLPDSLQPWLDRIDHHVSWAGR